MSHLRTLQQDMDDFTEFLESLPRPPGNDVRLLTQAFKSALQGEGPNVGTNENEYVPTRKTVAR